jgi:tripartite-type tricarboxylate transporter receptor subunit TctC
VPTVEQALGIGKYDVGTWFGIAGPAGMLPAVTAKLNGAVKKATALSEVQGRLAGIGGETAATTPEQMRDRVARELQTWTETVHDAQIERH